MKEALMSDVWAQGVWMVKEGRAEEFVAAWRDFAEWSARVHGPATAWLLRDRDRPSEFVSIGPWPSDAAIAAWRGDPAFGERIAAVRALVDGFQARTLDPAVAIGEGD
jgi:quinol monooxygenase YgiN